MQAGHLRHYITQRSHPVRRTAQGFVVDGVGIVTVFAQDFAEVRGEVFVELELHAATPSGVATMRSRASSAA